VQPLPRRVGLDPEHRGNVDDGQLLPRHQPQHLGISVTKPGECSQDKAMLVGRHRRLVDGRDRPVGDRAQAVLQPAAPGGAAPLMSDHPVGDPVQPHQRLFPGRHLIEAAPHGEERVRDRVVHRVDSNSPAAELTDRPVEPGMRLREPHLIGRPIGAC
jgi:hypothetical protein